MAIIVPILKSSDNDPHAQLNYRSISLNSCVAKIFSSILNKRILCYCEELELLIEEQNGFMVKSSCLDHILV